MTNSDFDDKTVIVTGASQGLGAAIAKAYAAAGEGIENTLKGHFPEIRAIVDATDHSSGENPYYS